MSILAFFGIIAIICVIFYYPVPVAFLLLFAVAGEQLGFFGGLIVIFGAFMYWMIKDPGGHLEDLDDHLANNGF